MHVIAKKVRLPMRRRTFSPFNNKPVTRTIRVSKAQLVSDASQLI